jgi:hypothetical protein
MNSKVCKRCNEIRDITCYRNNNGYVAHICKICVKLARQQYLKDTQEHVRQRYRKYCENNREKMNSIAKNYRDTHIQSKLRDNLSRRLREMLGRKNKSSTEYIGTNISIIKKWLESNFTQEMTWDNYGTVWQIDHTLPLNKVDLTDNENVNIVFNWKNLYPLDSFKNKSKSDNIHYDKIFIQEIKIKNFCKQHNFENERTDEYFEIYQKILSDITKQCRSL